MPKTNYKEGENTFDLRKYHEFQPAVTLVLLRSWLRQFSEKIYKKKDTKYTTGSFKWIKNRGKYKEFIEYL